MEAWVVLILVVALKGLVFFLKTRVTGRDRAGKAPVSYAVLSTAERSQQASPTWPKVMVIGGAGFLGRHVVEQLVEKHADKLEVVVFDTHANDKRADVTYIRGDICQPSHLTTALKGCTCVVHCASVVQNADVDKPVLYRVNVDGTKNIIEACLQLGVQCLVYTSSTSVMTPKKIQGPSFVLKEDAPYPKEFVFDYAYSKMQAEKMVLLANCYGFKTAVIRPGGLYGFGDRHLLDTLQQGHPGIGRGTNHIPLVWVEDAARAHVLAVEKLVWPATTEPKIAGKVFHACHAPEDMPVYRCFLAGGDPSKPGPGPNMSHWGFPKPRQLPQWFAMVLAIVNEAAVRLFGWAVISPFLTVAAVQISVQDCIVDISSAQRLLGWQPTPFSQVVQHVAKSMESRKAK